MGIDYLNQKYKSIREWAEAYRKKNWNIIPLYSFSKNPNSNKFMPLYKDEQGVERRGWLPLQTRLLNDEEFDQWFIKTNPTGLGVICGKMSGIFVVDEDSYKTDGMRFEFISPLRSKTARGGIHHFFKYKDGIKTSGFRKGVNIEIKSEGGFVVLPPSEVYIDSKKTIGKYQWKSVCPLDEVPYLDEEKLTPYRMGGSGEPSDLHDLVRVSLGEQHNSLRTLALKTLARFKESEWDIAAEFVRNEAAKYDPPHPLYRVEKMIIDCMGFIKKNRPEIVQKEIEKAIRRPKTMGEVAVERKKEKVLEKDAPSTGYAELDKIIKGFIPGHVYTLTGTTNFGKTSLCANFAHRVAKQGKKVLYFALEPEHTIVDYLASVRTDKKYDDLTEEDLMVNDPNVHIYGKEEISTLGDFLNVIRGGDMRYDVIFVDHIGYFVRGTSNFIQEQSNLMKELAWLAKENKIAIVIVAHLRKGGFNQKKDYIPTADDISGSGAFKQDSTEVMIITRGFVDKDKTILSNEGKLYVVKTKIGPNGSINLYFQTQKASIQTIDEIMGSSRSINDQLSALGFADQQKTLEK